jgi:hypothetical protein
VAQELIQHSDIGSGEIHRVTNWVFQTTASRLDPLNNFTYLDIHKVCFDQETSQYYGLSELDLSGNPTWTQLGGGGGGGGGGEANTVTSLGGGQSLYKDKVGVALRFYSLGAGTNISFSLASDRITINASQTQVDWNATSGVASIANKPTLGTAALKNVPASGNASTTEVVQGDDTRLTNARTPIAHTHVISDVTGLSTALASKLDLFTGDGLVRSTGGVVSYDPAAYLTSITGGMVTTALGFTPYSAANPSGYTSNVGTVVEFIFADGNTFDGTVTFAGTTPTLSLTQSNASASSDGKLTSTDWINFDSKQSALGSNTVNISWLEHIATASFLGRTAASTGAVEVLSASQATALLNVFGPSAKGLVPAAAATPDAAKFLNEAGNFVTVSVSIADNSIANAKLVDVASGIVKGRYSSGSGPVEDVTSVQLALQLAEVLSYAARRVNFRKIDFEGSGANVELPWVGSAASSGTFVVAASGVGAGRSGVQSITTSSSTNSGYNIATATSFYLRGGEISNAILSLTNVIAVTSMRFGFGDFSGPTVAVSNGVYFECTATNGGSIIIDGRTAASSSRSTTGTSFTATANTFYHLRLSLSADRSTATFTVYDESGTSLWTNTLTANIPATTTVLNHCLRCTNTTTTSGQVILNADYMDYIIPFTTVRGLAA